MDSLFASHFDLGPDHSPPPPFLPDNFLEVLLSKPEDSHEYKLGRLWQVRRYRDEIAEFNKATKLSGSRDHTFDPEHAEDADKPLADTDEEVSPGSAQDPESGA